MKKIMYLFMGILLSIMIPFYVNAAENVNYIDENGAVQSTTNYKVLKPYITWEGYNVWITVDDGWYVVEGDTLINGIKITGDVKIILKDNSKLTVGGTLAVNEGTKLTIYSQSLEESTMGKLTVNPGDGDCGIGGDSANGGIVIINGGYITANGGANGAGIGSSSQYNSAEVTINNGIVYANGGANGGAGIGTGGYNGKTKDITINGGTVVAKGGTGKDNYMAAGIGGGYNCKGGNVTINGGNVTATASYQKYCVMYSSGNGIGGGAYYGSESITINGGTVNASSNCKAALGASNIVINEKLSVISDNKTLDYVTNYSSALSGLHNVKVEASSEDNSLTGTVLSLFSNDNIIYFVIILVIMIVIIIFMVFDKEKKTKKTTKQVKDKKNTNKVKKEVKTTKSKNTKTIKKSSKK